MKIPVKQKAMIISIEVVTQYIDADGSDPVLSRQAVFLLQGRQSTHTGLLIKHYDIMRRYWGKYTHVCASTGTRPIRIRRIPKGYPRSCSVNK